MSEVVSISLSVTSSREGGMFLSVVIPLSSTVNVDMSSDVLRFSSVLLSSFVKEMRSCALVVRSKL